MGRVEADAETRAPSRGVEDVAQLVKRAADRSSRAALEKDHRPRRVPQDSAQRDGDAVAALLPARPERTADVRDRPEPAERLHSPDGMRERVDRTPEQLRIGGREVDEIRRVGDERLESGAGTAAPELRDLAGVVRDEPPLPRAADENLQAFAADR